MYLCTVSSGMHSFLINFIVMGTPNKSNYMQQTLWIYSYPVFNLVMVDFPMYPSRLLL